jgi:hypothetical protein
VKTLRTIFIIVSCLILFVSDCIKDKSADYKYIMVTVNLKLDASINTHPAAGEWIMFTINDPDPGVDINLLSGVTVRRKIYDDGGKVVDFTQTTGSEGVTSEQTAVFQLSKGEYLTFSGYMEAKTDIYNTKILPYSEANNFGEIPENSTRKTYTWNVVLPLYVE